MISLLLLMLLLVPVTIAEDSAEKREKAVAGSGKVLLDMYITLRNLVFPQSPITSSKVFNRFVLMMPGKVLNYWDYYPGKDYEESLLRVNSSVPEVQIPPSVMEKWFDIADVVVGADVFSGGVTAKSFGQVYKTVLSNTKVINLDGQHEEVQKRYNRALSYLTEVVVDPENVADNFTRLALYNRYQEEYSSKKLDMEDKINEARITKESVEYELWFQRNYPSMNIEVERAYTKWLAFGQKDMVELYKAYLDSGASGVDLERAHMALRASGVPSLDRTHTIYPVSFEPGNWYKYLLPKSKLPSRDMILSKISLLQSERDALITVTQTNDANKQEATDAVSELQTHLNEAEDVRKNKTEDAINANYDCLNKRAKAILVSESFEVTDPKSEASEEPENDEANSCSSYEEASQVAVGATLQKAQINSQLHSSSFMVNANDEYNVVVNQRVQKLTKEIEAAQAELDHAEAYLGGIVDSDGFQNLDVVFKQTQQALDDSWMSFEYDSESTHISTDQESTSTNVGLNVHAGTAPSNGLNLNLNLGSAAEELKNAMNSASLKVSGQVLRVSIKRPWFRPSIFDDVSLDFNLLDADSNRRVFVSPGPMTEEQVRDAVGDLTSNRYLMVEYVSSFLLARDVKLIFSGLDSSSVSKGMQFAATAQLTGNFGLFNLDANVGINKNKQSVTADRTSTGMMITIPGAQIIGYFTNLLPRFPDVQN